MWLPQMKHELIDFSIRQEMECISRGRTEKLDADSVLLAVESKEFCEKHRIIKPKEFG